MTAPAGYRQRPLLAAAGVGSCGWRWPQRTAAAAAAAVWSGGQSRHGTGGSSCGAGGGLRTPCSGITLNGAGSLVLVLGTRYSRLGGGGGLKGVEKRLVLGCVTVRLGGGVSECVRVDIRGALGGGYRGSCRHPLSPPGATLPDTACTIEAAVLTRPQLPQWQLVADSLEDRPAEPVKGIRRRGVRVRPSRLPLQSRPEIPLASAQSP